ncbi:HupE / UreJ protein [Chitinophaga costaii]|uniref:HupE / UreJ protein n=1 Tax=Chitinophaga costaii TaxID=1335309 RepID=A0A1C3ZFN0_9BACT|nr:HupE/UreJ family protein [Chitinophaga costaii]PUZ30351.1 HupE/UreJ family protein [Chitinophaga costaii]SCB81154.1 HupE / UreJ protein [Chitinophaga costaii]
MQDFGLYFEMGWQHILDWNGYDHILFVVALCALFLLQDWKKILVLVTAFTIGHSITLALSVLHYLHINRNLIEFLIPVTIVVTAFANIIRLPATKERGKAVFSYSTGRLKIQPAALKGRVQLNYYFALFFGLLHGLGFSTYLKSMLGAQTNIVLPLLSFNLGLEVGQLVIVGGVLLCSTLVTGVFQVSRRDWSFFLSSAIFGIALLMMITRAHTLLTGH